MKYTFLSLLGLVLALAQPTFAKPQFLKLEANSSGAYPSGQAAVLTAHIRIQPTNPNMEIFVSSSFDGSNLKLTRISAGEAVSITPAVMTPGNHVWHVSAFLQDKNKAQELEAAIAVTQEDNLRIERALQVETDPVIIARLAVDRQRNNDIIGRAQNQLNQNRRYLEAQDLSITVSALARAIPKFDNPVIAIGADHENATYAVGSRATFYVHALTDFQGPDGIQEILAFANINGTESAPGIQVERTRLGSRDFAFTSPNFVGADAGPRVFNTYLKIRSKAQADSIRNSVHGAIQRRSGYIALRDASTDPEKQAYYNSLIAEMDLTIAELNHQLEAMLVSAGNGKDFNFDIVPALADAESGN